MSSDQKCTGLRKLRARAGGYFWLPCDRCGHYFGGHEHGGGWILHDQTRSTMTCPRCPGHWIERDGRYIQLQPALDATRSPTVLLVSGSSEWSTIKAT